MKIVIENKEKNFKKEFDITAEQMAKAITHVGVLNFVGKEINRVRPPKRNIGLVFNWMTAMTVTDAIISLVFPKNNDEETTKEEQVVNCESYTEVKNDTTSEENVAGDVCYD